MNSVESTIASIPQDVTDQLESAVRHRWDSLTKPRGSLGRLEECVVRLAAIQGTVHPAVDRQAIYVFCGDHGITEEGVSAYPSVVTREMVKNFAKGGAAINVLCRALAVDTHIVDAGVQGPKMDDVLDRRIASGTRNFAHEPAMSRIEAIAAMETGIKMAEDASATYSLVGLGEMGIGNSTSASALLCVFTGLLPNQAAGRGAGLDDAGLQRKETVLTRALSFHNVSATDPIQVLSAFGGFEIAMMAGFFLGAAANKLLVVVDGFISSAAFLVAHAFAPSLTRFVLFAHQSAEPGHRHLLTYLQVQPMLALEMRLGEGTGAALAMNLLRCAVNLYNDMATFEQASVSEIL